VSELERLLATCLFEIDHCEDLKKLDNVRCAVLGKNGKITEMLKSLRDMPTDKRRTLGAEINAIKDDVERHLEEKIHKIEMAMLERKLSSEFIDISMPARPRAAGTIHPLTKVAEEVAAILSSYGFSFTDGPDIENEYYNFTALNLPDHHPARAMHDTFYMHVFADNMGRKLLRTHTSPVQIHAMLANSPPCRFFSIGRVFRSDYDATHTPMFNQIEGLMIDANVGFSHLKWLLSDFVKKFFEVSNISIRFRPSFFPFTEPSAEVDINYEIKDGKMVFGSGEKWLEIGGAGVVHPNVLKHGNVDADKYQGIAFGFGLERMASLKYGIPDLRGYFESDDRWRSTFGISYAAR
jgi:phenylalanyl-tRNA synthetase alpha chain